MSLIPWLKNSCFLISILWGMLVSGCTGTVNEEPVDDLKLASVFNDDLYFSEIVDLIPPINSEDSTVAVNNAINRWIRKTLLMREAERNIPQDLNIEKLVNDYRESLILHNYEQQLVEQNLDTTIAPSTLETYYEQYKSQYVLKYSIVKAYMLKVNKNGPVVNARTILDTDDPNIEDIQSLLESEDMVDSYVQANNWVKALDIIDLIPEHTLRIGDMREGRLIEFNGEDYIIFLKIMEKISDENIAPLSYIEDQIVRLILHERKLNMLEEINEQLYEQELKNNNIKIYTR